MEALIIIAIAIFVGYAIGCYKAHLAYRVQCTNCGGHNTYKMCEGYGGEGGKCEFAVKHMEQHVCNDCDKTTYVQMKLIK
jgi:hypothetical protein